MSKHTDPLIASAKALAAAGDLEAARESLLLEGFLAGEDSAVREAYAGIIPLPEELKKNLPQVKGLLSKDAAVRAKTTAWLCKETRLNYSLTRKEWLRDPRFSGILIEALEKEAEPKIARDMSLALAALIERYFADIRAFPVLAARIGDKDKVTRRCAAEGLGHIRHPERYAILIPMLGDKAPEVRHAVCRSVCDNKRAGFLTEAEKTALLPALLPLLGDKDQGVRTVCSSALRDCGDKSTIPHLEAAMKKETVAAVKDSIKDVIAILKGEKEWK